MADQLNDSDLRILLAYQQFDQDNDDELIRNLIRQRRRAWSDQSILAASKLIQYAVLSPPVGLAASKSVQYSVLSSPAGLSGSKFVQYVIILPLPFSVTPKSPYLALRLSYPEEIEEPRGLTPYGRRYTSPDSWIHPAPVEKPAGLRVLLANRFDFDDNDFTPHQIRRIIDYNTRVQTVYPALPALAPGRMTLLANRFDDETDLTPPQIRSTIFLNKVIPAPPVIPTSMTSPYRALMLRLGQIEEELDRSPDQIRQLIKLKMLTSTSLFYHQWDQVIWMG